MSFLDTAFDTYQHSQRYGSPKKLIDGGTQYNNLRYPLDIGSADKGHYMVIHINQQTKTQFRSPTTNELPTVIQNMRELESRIGPTNLAGQAKFLAGEARSFVGEEVVNKVSSVTTNVLSNYLPSEVSSQLNSLGSDFKQAWNGISGDSFLRTIERTTDSITLYMPDTLNFEYSQTYSDLALGNTGLGYAGAALTTLVDQMKNGNKSGNGQNNMSPFVAQFAAKGFGEAGQAAVAAGFGVVQNPMLELLYTTPNFRSFQFDFYIYPRSEKEALEVQKILERLRFHQAPEIKSNSGGFFMIPPSEFDIKFYYNGKINPNIDPISTCVLEKININYTPSPGFVAYESQGENSPSLGRTGMPVAIQLQLFFKEAQILTKDNFRKRTEVINDNAATSFPVQTPRKVPSEELPPSSFQPDGYEDTYGF